MRTAALLVAALAALLLAGCGAAAGTAPTVNVPKADAPAAPAQPAGERSERGNVIKKAGDVAAFGPTQAQLQVKFVIDKITVGAKCTNQYAQPTEHGTLLRLDVRAETTPDLAQSSFYSINPFDFSTIGPDGVTESSLSTPATYTCLDSSEMLPSQFAPSSKYRGAVILDTKNRSGVLQLRPGFMAGGGWEWQYPA